MSDSSTSEIAEFGKSGSPGLLLVENDSQLLGNRPAAILGRGQDRRFGSGPWRPGVAGSLLGIQDELRGGEDRLGLFGSCRYQCDAKSDDLGDCHVRWKGLADFVRNLLEQRLGRSALENRI
jgi:hypothetical protein